MHCECGSEEYNLKWNVDGEKWLVCAECGRPSSAVGVGWQKQQPWERSQDRD